MIINNTELSLNRFKNYRMKLRLDKQNLKIVKKNKMKKKQSYKKLNKKTKI